MVILLILLHSRLTAREALQHEYFMNVESRSPEDFAMDEDGSASSS